MIGTRNAHDENNVVDPGQRSSEQSLEQLARSGPLTWSVSPQALAKSENQEETR
jgi:hypothetical protein